MWPPPPLMKGAGAEPRRLVEVYFNDGELTGVSRVRQVQIARLHLED